MAFFMIEARVRVRRRLLLDRQHVGASLKVARVIRDVQDRVAAYILTVGLINLGIGVIVAIGAWGLGLEAPGDVGRAGRAAQLPALHRPADDGRRCSRCSASAPPPRRGSGRSRRCAILGLHAIESNVVTPSILGARFT